MRAAFGRQAEGGKGTGDVGGRGGEQDVGVSGPGAGDADGGSVEADDEEFWVLSKQYVGRNDRWF